MPSNRRHFLRTLGGTSMFAAARAPMSLFSGAESAHPSPLKETFDTAWADRIQGRFRAVFDSPQVSEGAGLFRAILWTDQYKEIYGTARGEMSSVLVLRAQEAGCRYMLAS